jgi:predicted RNase H-like HicB family nuclease
MSDAPDRYTILIHNEGPGQRLWAEVEELPGCFASGQDLDELMEAVAEAISLYLSEPGNEVHVELEDAPGSVTERHMLARTA